MYVHFHFLSLFFDFSFQLCFLLLFMTFLVLSLHLIAPLPLKCGGGYQSVTSSVKELWDLVQRRTVWWPMAFVYIYSMLQISNPVMALPHTLHPNMMCVLFGGFLVDPPPCQSSQSPLR